MVTPTMAVVKEGKMSLSCHHKGISQMKAEQLLIDSFQDGSFLVRDSETIPNAYTLCVLFQGSVKQYRILPDSEGMLFIQAGKGQERKYVDLLQLIHEMMQRTDRNFLICPLKHPVPVEVEDDEHDSDEDEIDGQPSHGHGSARTDRANVEMITNYFCSRLSTLNLSNHDSDFISRLRDYADERVHRDIIEVSAGDDEMKELRQIYADSAKELEKHVNIFLSKIETGKQLFGYVASPSSKRKNEKPKKKGSLDLPQLLEKCAQCKPNFCDLEKKALKTLQELKTKEWEVDSSGNIQASRNCRQTDIDAGRRKIGKEYVAPSQFQAALLKHGKRIKMTLMVNMQAGHFMSVKDSETSLGEGNTFLHDKIEQVIKCSNNTTMLDLLITDRKKETYIFDDVWSRETFCQMIHDLKMFHSSSQQVDHLSVFVGTWNMSSEVPPSSLGAWLKSQGQGKERSRAVGMIPHDMYVIGTQESALTEKDWVNRLKSSLHETMAYDVHDMHTVIAVSMWSLRIVILVRSDYKNKISHVQHSNVKTGIANKLGNKGAVGVSFQFEGTAFCFVNCHLTSGHERNAKRNQNVYDIIKGLSLGPKSSTFDITNRFHHLFFLGDLNYRLENIDPESIIKKVTQERSNNTKRYASLLENDQLRKSKAKAEVFFQFGEEDIMFPPSYRFEKGSCDKYSWQKVKTTGIRINAPSWCDRVLYKNYPETYMKNTSYGMVEDVKTSDHKPVFSSFDVGIISQTASHQAKTSRKATICFKQIKAAVRTTSKDKFKICFSSQCIEGQAESELNDRFEVSPSWSENALPLIKPIFDDRDYLEDQHILLAVKTADGLESYGECIIALKSMFSVKPEPFETYLTHRGEYTGKISGLMHVSMASQSYQARTRKTYELVCMDTDFPKVTSQVSCILDGELEYSVRKTNRDGAACMKPPDFRTKQTATDLRAKPPSTAISTARDTPQRVIRDKKTLSTGAPPATDFFPNRRPGGDIATDHGIGVGSGPPPSVPARPRTKQGLSSLATTSVLPASRVASKNNNVPRASPRMYPATRDENANMKTRDEQKTFHSLPVTVNDHEARRAIFTSHSSPPPVVPRRKILDMPSDQHSYEPLRKPNTINEWLLDLGIPEYIGIFHSSGWDQLEYLSGISYTDLEAMQIPVEEHVQRIWKSVRDMQPQ